MKQFKKLLWVSSCVMAFGLYGCATTSEYPSIRTSMSNMGKEMGAAMKSADMNEFSMHAHALRNNVMNAGQSSYPGTVAEQAMFKEGIGKLLQGLDGVDARIASGNLDGAKNALKELLPIRNQYHAVLKK